MSEGTERISVSRETLRAELTDLKLDLVDRINAALSTKADEAVVQEHDKRISQLELSRAAREHIPVELLNLTNRLNSLERFRWSVPSVALLTLLTTVALTIFYFTH